MDVRLLGGVRVGQASLSGVPKVPLTHLLLCLNVLLGTTAVGPATKAAASMTGWGRTLGWLCSSAVHRCAAGLGDVAVPGLLACLALRYDASRAVNMRSRAEAASAAISEVLADLDVSLFGTLHGSSPPLCRWRFLFAKPAALCLSLCPRKPCRDFCASPLLCLPAASPVWQADGRCQCQGCRCCL